MTLTVAPDGQTGTVLVTSTVSMSTIEVSLDAGTTWTTHYATSCTTRTLWEVPPALPFLVRASGSVVSSSQTLDLCGYLLGIWLTSVVNTSLSFAMGSTNNEEQGWDTDTSMTQLERAGQKHRRTFFSSLWTHGYDFDILIPPYLRLQDTTLLLATKVRDMADQMAGLHHELVYKDFEGIVRHCYLVNLKPHGYKGTMKRMTATLVEKDTLGALPFTT